MEIVNSRHTGEQFCEESNVEECLQFLSKEFLSLGIIGIKDVEEFNQNYGNNENINYINKNIINNNNKGIQNLNCMGKNNENKIQINSNDEKTPENASEHVIKDSEQFNKAPYKDIVWVINNSYKSLIRLRKFHEVKNHLQDCNTKMLSELTQSRGECNRWKEKVEGMNRELGVMEGKNGLLKEKVARLEKEGKKEKNEIRSLRAEISRSEEKSKVRVGKLQRQLDVIVTQVGLGLKSNEEYSVNNFPQKKIYGRKNVICSTTDVCDLKKNKEVLEKVVAIKVKSVTEKKNIAGFDNNSEVFKLKVPTHKQCSIPTKPTISVKTASVQSSFTKASFVQKSSPKTHVSSFNVKKPFLCPGTYKKKKNALRNGNNKIMEKDNNCDLSVRKIEKNESEIKNNSCVNDYNYFPGSNDDIKVDLFENNKVMAVIDDVSKDHQDNILEKDSVKVENESLLSNEDQITKNGEAYDGTHLSIINDNKAEKDKSLKDAIICSFIENKDEKSKQWDKKNNLKVDKYENDIVEDYDEDCDDDYDEDGDNDYDEDGNDDYDEDDIERDDGDVVTRPGPLIRSSSYTILKHDDNGDKTLQNSTT